jgi:hypothetical protein
MGRVLVGFLWVDGLDTANLRGNWGKKSSGAGSVGGSFPKAGATITVLRNYSSSECHQIRARSSFDKNVEVFTAVSRVALFISPTAQIRVPRIKKSRLRKIPLMVAITPMIPSTLKPLAFEYKYIPPKANKPPRIKPIALQIDPTMTMTFATWYAS